MSDDEGIRGSKRFNRLSDSDSSSREGSPQAKRPRRALTPNSDDGGLIVKPAGEFIDDTPPPEGQPIIRQAVAFNWNQTVTANVPTYMAIPPAPVATYYLPGQIPVATATPPSHINGYIHPIPAQRSLSPPRPAPPTQSTPRPNPNPRKKKTEKPRHFNDSFAAQTGRFKVGPGFVHEPEAAQAPATRRGSGPYSSMYRMTASPSPSMATLTDSQSTLSMAGYTSASQTSYSSQSSVQERTPTAGKPGRSATHYRRDYEDGRPQPSSSKHNQQSSAAAPSKKSKGTSSTSTGGHSRTQEQRGVGDSSRSTGGSRADRCEPRESGTPVPKVVRTVTLLIVDIRSGVEDRQLAEVKVAVREDGPHAWADAKDVCAQLQASPSRIEGPARVFCMRENYRQFFLRVTEENMDEATSTNLRMPIEAKVLNVFVEPLPRPGHPPPQPPISIGPYSEEDIANERFSSPPRGPVHPPRKRRRSPSPRHRQSGRLSPVHPHLQSSTPGPGLHSRPAEPNKRGSASASTSGDIYSQMSPRSVRYYEDYAEPYQITLPARPNVPGRMGETEEEVDAAIVRFIRPIGQENPVWMDYCASKARPPRISEILKQYQYVQDEVIRLDGIRTPLHWENAPAQIVRPKHVWRLLKMESPSGQDCQETLSLLQLYGPEGQRYQDSRVMDAIDETEQPRGKPYKRFLKLLRSIDEDWVKEHSEHLAKSSPDSSASGDGQDSMDGNVYS
ncbi:hypothetical protein FIBSPDRAFT_1045998 [Athelia psychrophila]|uniref:Uncharacterized protein n=1 Tax=Athelia psychrophila TaxID=1759441 RepID=A0A166HBW9_9AGAM|nr:hypothetical protein FIBSPDRAFT_1045998 [Fibularhizoctonia sp. CBS 109695]